MPSVQSEQDGVAQCQIDAEEIQGRRQNEEREEADLEPGAATLECGSSHGMASRVSDEP